MLLRRLLAVSVDWLFIVAWGVALFGIVIGVNASGHLTPQSPLQAQLLGFTTMTLPVVVTMSVLESSKMQATPGKRLLRLRVCRTDGERVSLLRAIGRNALKFLPWELGHGLAWTLAMGGDADPPMWLLALGILATLGPAWWVIALWRRGHTPYDRASGTVVQRR
ncbi:MAG: RDD family protein [Deltaproteobacteria bacterium]|nr:RDD family protein [Deltaproteobacteria bacterium]